MFLNYMLLTAAAKVCEWIKAAIDAYILHHKCQVKPYSPSWFSAASAISMAHRNHLFCLCQQNRSSLSDVKFTNAINCFKRVFETDIIPYTDKTKESISSQKLGSHEVRRIAVVFSIKVNLPYLLFLTDLRFRVLHLIRQIFFLKSFQRTPILIAQGPLYLISPLEII